MSKLPFLGSKMGGIEFSWFPASPVHTKYQKLFRRGIEVGKSEKIIEIGPETAEIDQKSPEIGKIAKIAKFRSDIKITKFGLF